MSATVVAQSPEFKKLVALACEHAAEIDESASRRRSAPVRVEFVRDAGGGGSTPLSDLVRVGGRGGGVALRLYLSLIWRSSAEPFTTSLPARKWAELLALPDPSGRGARRIVEALKTLEAENLIAVERRSGDTSVVTLLHESGSGAAYTLPRGDRGERYLQVPSQLWLNGELHELAAPGVAMLLAVLVDQSAPGEPVWWATSVFHGRFGLSPATRARGTKELVTAGLLSVKRAPISTARGRSFAAERVRNVYSVTGAAKLWAKKSTSKTSAVVKPMPQPRRAPAPRSRAGSPKRGLVPVTPDPHATGLDAAVVGEANDPFAPVPPDPGAVVR